MLDIIVPTIPGRQESMERLIDSLKENTVSDYRLIMIEDSETCGWGWRKGLESSDAPYVLLACDDQEYAAEGWDLPAIEAVQKGYIACPRVWLPDGRVESNGGDMDAHAHIIGRPQKDWTPVDYSTVPFLSQEAIREIGMIDVHYASDVWVSYRGRQLGYESVLRHGFDLVHHQEKVGRGAGMTQGERDAMDCAAVYEALKEKA